MRSVGGAASAEPLNTLSRRAPTNDKSLEPRESGVAASKKTLREAPGSWSPTGIGVPVLSLLACFTSTRVHILTGGELRAQEENVVHRGPEFETLQSRSAILLALLPAFCLLY